MSNLYCCVSARLFYEIVFFSLYFLQIKRRHQTLIRHEIEEQQRMTPLLTLTINIRA
jgi:hypothetical protein